ncbi:uncharacterized protein BX663DRAFT_520974 [Cokeromyces recurvatus]|uniref:uncharacterized protein n=1 Tax=Cokeromyces recurvatus TaxID=90255 RepID=UPI0022211D41|nr:uncharacterized protein BX663DRAFT_520974 [Cokeromyces recurvatus]KAI7899457.1 hypothetical protein BX663DRAFT_520974 [Cokeromyces recurvatus]
MTMKGCIPCINVKHATLINNCYPPLKENSTIPRSSDLSYLTFYASSRPAKLTKVGSFLQKKVEKSIRKGRKSQNLVTLHIIKALIQTCHRDLNIFSKYIVKILNQLLDTRDLEIIDLSCETFIIFCSYHDGTTLSVDSELTTDYENLLRKFAVFCNYMNEDSALSLKMRYIGHRAIQAAVTSSALLASNFKIQLDIIFPSLIMTLASSRISLEKVETSGSIDIRHSAINNNKINDQVNELLATHTITLLFSKITGPLIRISLTPLFKYLNENHKWWPPHLIVKIIKISLNSVQSQYRYLLVSDLMTQLELTGDMTLNDKHASLISVLDMILNADVPLVGISVLEILNSLFNFLIKTTQNQSFNPYKQDDDDKTHVGLIQYKTVCSIAGLASQIYYENQLNDIIDYLVSKLRPNTSLEYVDDLLLYDYRFIVFSCLEQTIVVPKHPVALVMNNGDDDNDNNELSRASVNPSSALEAWNSSLDLLHDENPRTRMMFCKCLNQFLQHLPSKANPSDKHKTHTMILKQDALFIDRLLNAMLNWVLISDFNTTDLRFFYITLCILVRKFDIDAMILIVPFVFKVQQLIQENQITFTVRQYAIESSLIAWFIMIAHFYHVESLLDYMNRLQEKRNFDANEDLILTETINEAELAKNELELFSIHVESKSNNVWIDRNKVVELLSKEETLRDETDRDESEIEAKLLTEWGAHHIIRNNQSVRSRLLYETNESKPKLSSPWEHTNDELHSLNLEDKKHNIRVANLKEALTAGQSVITDDVDTDSSTQSNSFSLHQSPITTKSKTEVNALLTELNLFHIEAPSNISLVNPPYKST